MFEYFKEQEVSSGIQSIPSFMYMCESMYNIEVCFLISVWQAETHGSLDGVWRNICVP
jgi:hypothetical protein